MIKSFEEYVSDISISRESWNAAYPSPLIGVSSRGPFNNPIYCKYSR